MQSTERSSRRARRSRRFRNHGAVALGVALLVAIMVAALPGALRERLSLATAYAGLLLLAATLSIGPLRLLRGGTTPVSLDLRRDLGIWAAVLGVIHTGLGLTMHFTGRMWLYFLAPPDKAGLLGLRADTFGAANHAGLVAALLLLILTAISNDRSLTWLGARRWRAVQRWAYLILALTILHGALYQVLESRRLVLVGLFVLLSGWTVLVQLAGWRRVRARDGAS